MSVTWAPDSIPLNDKFDFAARLGDEPTITDETVERAHLLGAGVHDLVANRVRFRNFQAFDTVFASLKMIQCAFDGGELVAVRFVDSYFRRSTFEGLSLRDVTFERCTFDDFHLPVPSEPMPVTFRRCLFVGTEEAVLRRQAQLIDCTFVDGDVPTATIPSPETPKAKAAAPAPATKPAPAPAPEPPLAERFAQLER